MLQLDSLAYAFPGGHQTVNGVSLSVGEGEFFCLLGPSGCGKSTLLHLIGGYIAPESGVVRIDGRDVTHEPPDRRPAGMVFQTYALFPHLTALDNVAFGLRVRGVGREERRRRSEEMLDWVRLSAAERLRRPSELSGGQQQRVALARALILKPRLLMLDEPFANLDRLLREELRDELRQIQREAGVTTLLVTHDREEAFALADRMAIMAAGRFLQCGAAEEVFHSPATAQVAEFLGCRNRFRIVGLEDGGVRLAENADPLPLPGTRPGKGGDWLLIRSERLRFHPADASRRDLLAGRVVERRFAGAHTVTVVELAGGLRLETLQSQPWDADARVGVEFPPDSLRILPGP